MSETTTAPVTAPETTQQTGYFTWFLIACFVVLCFFVGFTFHAIAPIGVLTLGSIWVWYAFQDLIKVFRGWTTFRARMAMLLRAAGVVGTSVVLVLVGWTVPALGWMFMGLITAALLWRSFGSTQGQLEGAIKHGPEAFVRITQEREMADLQALEAGIAASMQRLAASREKAAEKKS